MCWLRWEGREVILNCNLQRLPMSYPSKCVTHGRGGREWDGFGKGRVIGPSI